MTHGRENFKYRGEGTMDLYHLSIKAIQCQYTNAVYILDVMGNVGKYVGATGCNTMHKFENCTDIFTTDALYARQFHVDEKGKLVSRVIRLTDDEGEEIKDFSVNSGISAFSKLEGYFSASAVAFDHLMSAHSNSIFIKKENQTGWLDRIDFEHQIVTLLPCGGEKLGARTLCATEDTIEILTLNKSGSGIDRGDQLNLPGNILWVEIGALQWCESNIFVLT